MKINLNSYNAINSYSNLQKATKNETEVSFGSAKARKLMEKIKNTKNLKEIKVTFDDMVSIYQELGFDTVLKRGSHAVIPISATANLPLVIPHGTKHVHPLDIKRLQCILNGEIEKALNVH
ncbi:hypothetical protein IKA15_03835 [bacterium]|nr:hypothetical protein [bacterium]